MERAASASTIGGDTLSSRNDCCISLFDSFTGSRLAYLETPEGGTRSSSHREDRIAYPLPQGSSGKGPQGTPASKEPPKGCVYQPTRRLEARARSCASSVVGVMNGPTVFFGAFAS